MEKAQILSRQPPDTHLNDKSIPLRFPHKLKDSNQAPPPMPVLFTKALFLIASSSGLPILKAREAP